MIDDHNWINVNSNIELINKYGLSFGVNFAEENAYTCNICNLLKISHKNLTWYINNGFYIEKVSCANNIINNVLL